MAPQYDLILRGARVVDGTGIPAYVADVGVKGDRIAKIGRIEGDATRVIEAKGLVLAPGFIDIHTHYDVQLDWDPIVTPSCWHGITTVLAGNCGFTLAPAKPEDVDWLAGMLSRVEGMSRDALAEGLKFSGGGHGDYWGRFEGKVGVNVASYVGHSAVRRFVMGDDASEREATTEEIEQMKECVRQAMREGAIGFSTSQLDLHVGEDGREVPSNHASADEVVALAGVLSEFDRGACEIIPRSFGRGYDDADRELMLRMHEASGRPVELNLLFPSAEDPESWSKSLDFCREQNAKGARLHPQFATNRGGLHVKLSDTFVFDDMPVWRDTLVLPLAEACVALRDAALRDRMRHELATVTRTAPIAIETLEVEYVRDPGNECLLGKTVEELMADGHEGDALDVFLDVSLREDLNVGWTARTPEVARQFIDHVVTNSIREPLVMSGSSDGGAHLASFVGADYTTRLLTDHVPEILSLEEAIWRLTGMPAAVHGLVDRGTLRVGAKADVTIFDLDGLAAGEHEVAADFPGGTERWTVDAEGFEAVIVNGVVVMEQGKHTGALPGEVLRGA